MRTRRILGLLAVLCLHATVARAQEVSDQLLVANIYARLARELRNPEIQVRLGLLNGLRSVIVAVRDTTISNQDSAVQADMARIIALRVRELLRGDSALKLVSVGWSTKLPPGARPIEIHSFTIGYLDSLALRQ
jgi:hypothetical protein